MKSVYNQFDQTDINRHQHWKRKFFVFIAAAGVPIILLFTAFDILEADLPEIAVDLAVLTILAGVIIGLVRVKIDNLVYLISIFLLHIVFLANVAIETRETIALFWMFILPAVTFTFLTRKHAFIITSVSSLVLAYLVFNPGRTPAHPVNMNHAIRFMITYCFIVAFSAAFEISRFRHEQDLEEARQSARSQRDFLNTLLETIPTPVFFKGVDGRYIGCNKAFEQMIGFSREEIINRTVKDVLPKDVADLYWDKDQELFHNPGTQVYEWMVKPPNGDERDVLVHKSTFFDKDGNVSGLIGVTADITERKKAQQENERLIQELQDALADVKTLRGFLPICSHCKNIRDDKGYWSQVESYIRKHTDAEFSHSICPDCARKHYPELKLYDD